MELQQSIFSRIASALTVLEIAEPIEWSFEVGTPFKTVCDQLQEGRSRIVLITDNGAPRGFAEVSGYLPPNEANWKIEQKSQPIEIRRVITAQTSLLELIPLWDRSYYFFILDGTRISHFVARHHVDTAPVKAALFALTAELEERMLHHLMDDLDQIKARFERLTTYQQQSVKRLFDTKLYADLLKENENRDMSIVHNQNTYFSHKVKMFLETPELLSLLPFATKDEARKDFDLIIKLRNTLAHGGSLLNIIRDATQLKPVIDWMENVLISLK